MRPSKRAPEEMRTVSMERNVARYAEGSCLVKFGNTNVLCCATLEERGPSWLRGTGKGWVTAEYAMLPRATLERTRRESTAGRPTGRTQEIQRLIGRSLRAVVDLGALGERQIVVDCDVLQADGGTRTASITGASVAVELACRALVAQGKLAALPIKNRVAAVSVGIVKGEVLVDLDYLEDRDAEVDMNIVMTDKMDFVEVQGSGEESVFSAAQLEAMVAAAGSGIAKLLEIQNTALSLP